MLHEFYLLKAWNAWTTFVIVIHTSHAKNNIVTFKTSKYSCVFENGG